MESGAQRKRATLYLLTSHFGHSLTVQPKELLTLSVCVKLCIGSKVVIMYTVCCSFGDPLAEQPQPCCLLPGDTGLVVW